jgi:ABC-type lipoprotein export system ATPase subunit
MSLIKETFAYAKTNTLTKYYTLVITMNNIVFTTIIADLTVRITEETLWIYLPWIIGITAIIPIINWLIVSKISNVIINQICNRFLEEKYFHFSRISYENKIKTPFDPFKQALNPSKNAIGCMMGWGLPNFIQLVSVIINVFWTFWKMNILLYFFVLFGGFGIFYISYLRPKQEVFTKEDKRLRKIRHTMEAKIILNGTPFQYNEVSYIDMIEYEHCINDCGKELETNWDNIMNETNVVLTLLSIVVIYFGTTDTKSFLLISAVMGRFSLGCQSLMQYMTQYNRFQNDFETLTDIFKNAPPTPEPEKMYLSTVKQIGINYVDIPLGDNYRLTLDPNFGEFSIKANTNIIIIGPSGCGKSSFIKGFFGLLEKAKVGLTIGEGKNFYHTVADYFQEIKEKMPSSKVTIRDYFRKEKDDNLIKSYLLKSWTQEEYDRIFEAIRESNKKKSKDHISIDMEPLSNDFDVLFDIYDLLLNEKLSGGQKSRLILWNRGYIVDKLAKEIVVLDEPCPDVDHLGYKDNISRFFEEYSNKAKIMVAHPCECKEKFLFPMFDIIIEIGNDGVIRRRKWNATTLKLE